jgi:hypothetical protein
MKSETPGPGGGIPVRRVGVLFGDYARKQTAASAECPPVTVLLPGSCRDRVARWEPISCRCRHNALASQR